MLHARIAAEIERFIRTQRLSPGHRLPSERELAGILQVGRSSLREAIAVLSSRGVVRVRRGHGIYVAEPSPAPLLAEPAPSPDDLEQLFDMREVLEVAAAGWAAQAATEDDIAALRATIAALDAEATADPPDLERLQELDTDFHLLVAAVARNRFLAQMTQLLHRMLAAGMETTLSVPGRISRSRRSHLRIAEAIASHDHLAARTAMREHIREARDAALRRRGEPGGDRT